MCFYTFMYGDKEESKEDWVCVKDIPVGDLHSPQGMLWQEKG